MIVIYCTLISHNMWNIQSVFAEKLYLKLVEIQEYTDQYLEYRLKGLAQAKIIKKSVILFRVLNMTI